MNKNRLKAVLFDFDDTLQDRALAFEGYCDFFLTKYFPQLSSEEHAYRMDLMEHTVNGGYIDREVYFSALIREWGWTEAPSPGELSREYDDTFGGYVRLFPGSRRVLEELRQRGYFVGVITNGPSALQNAKLDASGLRPLLDVALVSGDVGARKPEPAIFQMALEQLGIGAQEALYVGDHPVNDIQGALGAGMQALWMQYGTFRNQGPQGVEKITSITQVLQMLPD